MIQRSESREQLGCLPALGCGVFIFLIGIFGFIILCLAIKGIFN